MKTLYVQHTVETDRHRTYETYWHDEERGLLIVKMPCGRTLNYNWAHVICVWEVP